MTGVLILPAGRRCRDGSEAMNGRPGFEKICTFATACAILQLQEMVSRGICKIQKLLYAGNLRSCKAENSSKNNLNNKSVRFGHFSTYIKNNLGRAISLCIMILQIQFLRARKEAV